MPRQAHGRLLLQQRSSKPAKRKPALGRGINALEIAEKRHSVQPYLPRHRLGEVSDDSDDANSRPREDEEGRSAKRRKTAEDKEDVPFDGLPGSDGEEDPWHEGVNSGDEDSEIDSDDAFGDGDEERFEGFKFGATGASQNGPAVKKKDHVRREIDLSEQPEDDLSDDFGKEGVDLATAWDMDDDSDRAAKQPSKTKTPSSKIKTSQSSRELKLESESDGVKEDEYSEDDEASQDESSQLSVSDYDDEEGHTRLQDFVENLQTDIDSQQRTSHENAADASSSNLSAADLLKYVNDPLHRQSLKLLINNAKAVPAPYKGGVPGKLEPPLAKRQQDRLDRTAAYDKSKATLNRWIETVKLNRRADHISFPLQDPNAFARLSASELAPTVHQQPQNSLEQTVQQIMQESGMLSQAKTDAEEDERAFEELQENKMPLEEVLARRAELRSNRDLMFREEIRARRIKKIKSKAYRRVHRKEKHKTAQEERAYLAAAGLLNSDEERENTDRRRAEERMGARHRESKWAKGVKATGRTAWDENARHGVQELARKDEALRRRIEGRAVADSDASDATSSSESEAADVDTDDEHFDLEKSLDALDDASAPKLSGLGSMAFMQKGEAAKRRRNDQEAEDIRRQLNGEGAHDKPLSEPEGGRMKFGVTAAHKNETQPKPFERSEFEEQLTDDERQTANIEEPEEPPTAPPRTIKAAAKTPAVSAIKKRAASHPYETISATLPCLQSQSGTATEPNPHKRATKVTIDKGTNARNLNEVAQQVLDKVEDSSDSGAEHQKNGDVLDLTDNAAIAKALFAGDEAVEDDFNQEKRQTMDEEGDQIIDNNLPGWGSWTGHGLSKKAQKRNKNRFLTVIKGVSEDKRKDAKLEKVIINEKTVKKNGKYLANELPHPFESRQQYERSLRLPIGPEWTTKSTFQDATKPRVLVKQGIIRPIARPIA